MMAKQCAALHKPVQAVQGRQSGILQRWFDMACDEILLRAMLFAHMMAHTQPHVWRFADVALELAGTAVAV